MFKKVKKHLQRGRRQAKIRARVIGTKLRPRLSVFRSHQHIYAQLIDDAAGRTLAATSSKVLKGVKGKKSELATLVGRAIAEAAKKAGIVAVAFDRGGFRYHGRVKALAEGAREGGLKF